MGIFDTKSKDLDLHMYSSKLTSDAIVDSLHLYCDTHNVEEKYKKILIRLDNGPEQNSSRTQFIKRIQDFSNHLNLEVELCYYPPYHSKYNLVERTFGGLEKHWMGRILHDKDTIEKIASQFVWAGKKANVTMIDTEYNLGVKVPKDEMKEIRSKIDTKEGIEKWALIFKPQIE